MWLPKAREKGMAVCGRGFRGMFVADLGGEVAMGLRRLPALANHCAQRASFALLQGKWIEFRELTYTEHSKIQ